MKANEARRDWLRAAARTYEALAGYSAEEAEVRAVELLHELLGFPKPGQDVGNAVPAMDGTPAVRDAVYGELIDDGFYSVKLDAGDRWEPAEYRSESEGWLVMGFPEIVPIARLAPGPWA